PLPSPSPLLHNGRPLPASYANFVILNGAIIVPTYRDPQDQEALKTMERLFPSRDIIGLDAVPLIREGGSIHCSSMNLYKG
ncbi:MAG: agmatine deiminase family protein, partial [Epsilonproteobacteria bacterium]|nr:agmatine deiminase [Campylobacterota bacterium]NPA57497.1 agmatine deiminase family protein [Campylobacterota bacterium]